MKPAVRFVEGEKVWEAPQSMLAGVTHGLPREDWPCRNGDPLVPVVQLNLSDVPYRPPLMRDVAFLTLFVHPDLWSDADAADNDWCLRTYRSTRELVALKLPESQNASTNLEPVLVEDYPCFEELNKAQDESFSKRLSKAHPTWSGIKIGGWPLENGLFSDHAAQPNYLIQVDSPHQTHSIRGRIYIGRGTAPGKKNEWVLQWQCF